MGHGKVSFIYIFSYLTSFLFAFKLNSYTFHLFLSINTNHFIYIYGKLYLNSEEPQYDRNASSSVGLRILIQHMEQSYVGWHSIFLRSKLVRTEHITRTLLTYGDRISLLQTVQECTDGVAKVCRGCKRLSGDIRYRI